MRPDNSSLASGRSYAATLGALVAIGLSLLPSTAPAGGPLYLCDSGTPYVWPNGGLEIPFHLDLGKLGPLSPDQATTLVTSAFAVWQDVPTATVTFRNAGSLPVDVDITNFATYLFPTEPDGQSAIVFDDTGEIFDLLFGANSGILGFAGPEWFDPETCTVLEGVCFLNGPAFSDPTYAKDVMVHEFGHYIGLSHTAVNGQIGLGDHSGPSPNDTFGSPDFDADIVETMYPFYFGPGIGTSTPEADDVAILSTLYPEPGFFAQSGSIGGSVRSPAGLAPLTGVNVIARNVANPFEDAVSAMSGDYSTAPGDAFAGRFRLNGLTPGAAYAVYVDQILAGGFSTTPITLPGPEEFYNGDDETGSSSTDEPTEYVTLTPSAGTVTQGVDIILNGRTPGEKLPLADDGSIELFLPFAFTICEQRFSSVWVNANGSLTFGAADGSVTPTRAGFLFGPPRVAGLWRDLDPSSGGTVTFDQSPDVFSVIFRNVPLFGRPESVVNMTLKLYRTGNRIDVQYGTMPATDGLVGVSCGSCQTSGIETPTDLAPTVARKSRISLWRQPAIFEEFDASTPFDLSTRTVLYQATTAYNDLWAGANNTFATAKTITLPFDSSLTTTLTEIEPVGADIDFFRFHLNEGETLTAEILAGCLDSLLGLFSPSGELLLADDDGGVGVLSRLEYTAPAAGQYVIAASAYGDFAFTGAGGSGGRYVLALDTRTCPPPESPGPDNWLVNGSFETGDLEGWTTEETGSPLTPWAAFDASGAGFFRAYEPQHGCFLAANGFDGDGPMLSALFQEVIVPAGFASLTLEWKDRVQWDLLNFTDPPASLARQYGVEIVDPTSGAVLQTVHLLVADAASVGDTGWVSRQADLTAYLGQTIRLRFFQDIPQSFSGPGQFELDDVRLHSN